MKTINIALVRLIQFLVLLFFTFVVLLWYGCVSLIPLAVLINLGEFFGVIFGPITSTIIALIVIGAVGIYLYKIPKLLETFLATGVDLIKLGNISVRRLGDIAAATKNNESSQERKIEIILKNKST